jgi:membrane-associated PAP2 superfamily phosphatase
MFDFTHTRQHAAKLVILALSLIIVFELSPVLNFEFSDWIFAKGNGNFKWRNSFWFETVLHDQAQILPIVIFLAVMCCWVSSFQLTRLQSWRRPLGYVLVAGTAAALSVDLLKHLTDQACPWNLEHFGGETVFRPWFIFAADEPQQCWPGGHASGGFAQFAWVFALYQRGQKKLATWVFVGVLIYGNVLGFAQVFRGAHFLSDHLWTALICWVVSWSVYCIWPWAGPVKTPRPNLNAANEGYNALQ